MLLRQDNKIAQIQAAAKALQGLTDLQLQTRGRELRYMAMSGAARDSIVMDGFPLVLESVRRVLGFSLYDVQLACGIHMIRGRIAEMKTGEGKTLTAALPAFVNALYGRGVHVVTVNDYLAKRDCELLGPIYKNLGLTASHLQTEHTPEQRKQAYASDITYGAAKEFGFDFLRDRLKRLQTNQGGLGSVDRSDLTMRPLAFALVDEADSILIDESRTPLIIGMVDSQEEAITQDCYRWAAGVANEFTEDVDFKYNHDKKNVELTLAGRSRLRRIPQVDASRKASIHELYDYIQNAIKVRRDYHLDKNYAIVDEKILIIDEFTGRPAEGRQWQKGIHQSVEAKENLPITPATRQAAMVTIQSFFRRYDHMSGMTGTAWTSRREFRKVFRKKVVRIPTHRPINREALEPRVFVSMTDKFRAIVEETRQIIDQGRSVLIGTRSVEKSELLSKLLDECRVAHTVLNAKFLEKEAEIVASAGQSRAVTVATNMAGRGTDIKLDPRVGECGGLHVILTELHESKRIDWQLIGRGSRQGDPGSFRIFVSLDDEILLTGLGPKRFNALSKRFQNQQELDSRFISWFRKAQSKTERKHLVDRMVLLRQDKERHERQFESGSDPYLDIVE